MAFGKRAAFDFIDWVGVLVTYVRRAVKQKVGKEDDNNNAVKRKKKMASGIIKEATEVNWARRERGRQHIRSRSTQTPAQTPKQRSNFTR